MIRPRLQSSWTPVAAAVVVSAVLLASTYFIHRSVRDASYLVAKGMGEAFFMSGWETLGGPNYPPSPEVLKQFLDAHAADGLRYVATLEPDGKVLASAGEAVGEGITDGVTLIGDRARLVGRIRPNRPPGPPMMRPPPDAGGPDAMRRRLPRIVYEFAPLPAIELQHQSLTLFFVAGVACLGVIGLALALTRSLSQRERLRGELEHGRKLAALGSMSAVLAHELRNPLASLKGHAQLLAETVEGDPKLATKAGRVVNEAVRLEHLTNNLLDFVKTGELRRAPADPAAVLRAAVAATDGERIVVAAPAETKPIPLDADRLQQALENVLRNAVQASPDGARVEAELARSDGAWVFSVRDRGPGFEPGDEQRIFEPFVTRRTKGIGLGLAITRQIVELHGGTVTARNRADGGAELLLRIPEA